VSVRRRSGFTLVEILVAAVLGAALSAVALQAAFYFLSLEKRILSDALAWERGQNVLSILEPRVLHAGLGITYERVGNVFQLSFGGNAADTPPPARWIRGPLQIWDGYPSLSGSVAESGGVCRGRSIVVLYAIPSALKVKASHSSVDMAAGNFVTVELVPHENLTVISDRLPTRMKNDLRAWVTFPLMRLPVYVSGYSGGKVTICLAGGSGLAAVLRPYDEMHYLRAERFQVQKGRLYSEELTNHWDTLEERLEGVLEMWFEWTPSKRLLEAWILTTGGAEEKSSGSGRPAEWPKEAPWRGEFEHRNLAVTRGSWILRNM
jgi:prepilin-type N-terminal cleavage/methylation domain-containing protein